MAIVRQMWYIAASLQIGAWGLGGAELRVSASAVINFI